MIKFKNIKKKNIIIACGIAIIIVAGVCIGINSKVKGKSSTDLTQLPISVTTLEKRDLSKVVGTNGVVESENLSKITTSITSNVKELNIQPGDKVKEGDTLCVFDDVSIKSEIAKLEETITLAKKAEQYQDGVNQRALTNAQEDQNRQTDNATNDINQAKSDVDSANNKVSDAEGNISDLSKEIKNKKKNLKKLEKKRDELNKKVQELTNSGDTVNTDATKADITPVETDISVAQSEINTMEESYTSAETELAALRESVKATEKVVQDTNENLESVQASTSQTVQSQVDNINTSKFKTDDSENETQLEKLKTNLANTVITAPISGTITYLNIEKGSPASEGVIMKIENTDALKISVKVKEYDILNIKEGMKATITCDAIPNVTMQGVVSKIFLTPITTSATTTDSATLEYAAEIKLDEENTDLLIGMNVKTKIVLEENKDVFAVPYEAVTMNESNQNIVYAAIDEGNGKYTVKSIPVEKGIETDYYAAISSDELVEGMYIITTPEMVTEGSSVLIQVSDDVNSIAGSEATAVTGTDGETVEATADAETSTDAQTTDTETSTETADTQKADTETKDTETTDTETKDTETTDTETTEETAPTETSGGF